ncbi:MAG: hypothetical protein EXS35_07705 [Pedosphaera sp.]|nr:hypothetical protein [Pedosphaera sp.]
MMAITASEPALELEGCLACSAVWFDAPTFESLSDGVLETTNAMPRLATEMYAELKLKQLKQREEAEKEKARKKKKRVRDL